MAMTHFKSVQSGAQTTTLTYTLTVGENIPAGKTILIATFAQDMGTDPTCDDNVNGAYTRDVLRTTAIPTEGAVFRFSNNAALVEADVITVTFGANTFHRGMLIGYADDIKLTSPLDQTPAQADGTSTTPSSGDLTLANDNVRWIGAIGSEEELVDFTEDADFTNLGSDETASRMFNWATRKVTASETNAYAPTLAASNTWTAFGVAYIVTTGNPWYYYSQQ